MLRVLFTLFLAFVIIIPVFASEKIHNEYENPTVEQMRKPLQANGEQIRDELDEVVWTETFSGNPPWQFRDADNPFGSFWNPSEVAPFDSLSWHCYNPAFGDFGGYDNHWLEWMLTPTFNFLDVESMTLSFQMRLVCEDPQNAPEPYDGWDAANVWITIDGGETWEVIEPTDGLGYNVTSSFAFGDEWMMGPDIPGWAGAINDWETIEIDLTPYVGNEAVRIRFGFCSDGNSSTADGAGPDWTGFQLDEITVAQEDSTWLYDNAEGEHIGGPFSFSSGLGGGVAQSWTIQPVDDAPSAPNAVGFSDFNTGFLHYFQYNGTIDLTADSTGTTMLDCMVKGNWDHPNDFPDNAYWAMKVRPMDNDVWYYAANPYGEVPGTDYVYTSAPADWQLFSESYPTAWDLTPYHGQELQIRLEFHSPEEDYFEGETYIYIDDITVNRYDHQHDMGVVTPVIPYPLTVGIPNISEVTFYNGGANPETASISWNLGETLFGFADETIMLNAGESVTYRLDNALDDEVDGWVPDAEAQADVFVSVTLDNDDNPVNNVTNHIYADIMPEGQFEYGYDDRVPDYMTDHFGVGEGPMTHFILPDNMPIYSINTLRVMWNGDIEEGQEYEFNYHIFAGGDVPGEELFSSTATASVENVYPAFMDIDVSNVPEVQNLEGDFWVWFELLDESGFPHIVFSEQNLGAGLIFEYDGETLVDGDGDWLIRVVGTEGEEVENGILTIPLQANYFELISTNLIPLDFNVARVFGQLESLSIVYQDDGGVFIPPNINTIGDIQWREGYRVFCESNEELTILGSRMNPRAEYTVTGNRWNWVGYPYGQSVDASIALQEIADDIQIVLTDDGRFWIPADDINTIGAMREGEGYMLFPSSDLTFRYDEDLIAQTSPGNLNDLPQVEGAPKPTGLPYVVLISMNENVKTLKPALVELYDGNQLVGKNVVLDSYDKTPVIAWQGAPDNGLNGFTPGNSIKVVIRDASGQRLPIKTKVDRVYGEGAYATTSLETTLPVEFSVLQGYPNPFNPSVTVPFALPSQGEIQISIYNVMGQQVFATTQKFEAGFHRYVFEGNNMVSGVYFLNVAFRG
ncbi:T9SS type A sorting domain-containing protein, partial [bacterium]|nr:T9SS type A sorting domain-containing protein [bacterium]